MEIAAWYLTENPHCIFVFITFNTWSVCKIESTENNVQGITIYVMMEVINKIVVYTKMLLPDSICSVSFGKGKLIVSREIAAISICQQNH